jgi:hypothetical protein
MIRRLCALIRYRTAFQATMLLVSAFRVSLLYECMSYCVYPVMHPVMYRTVLQAMGFTLFSAFGGSLLCECVSL